MTSTIKKVVFDDVPNIDKHKSSATFPESEIEVVDLEPPKHNDSLIYVDIVNGYLNIPYITTDSIKDLLQRLISEKKTDFYKYTQGLSNLDEYFIYLTVVDITRSDLTLDEKIDYSECLRKTTVFYMLYKNGIIKDENTVLDAEELKRYVDAWDLKNHYETPELLADKNAQEKTRN